METITMERAIDALLEYADRLQCSINELTLNEEADEATEENKAETEEKKSKLKAVIDKLIVMVKKLAIKIRDFIVKLLENVISLIKGRGLSSSDANKKLDIKERTIYKYYLDPGKVDFTREIRMAYEKTVIGKPINYNPAVEINTLFNDMKYNIDKDEITINKIAVNDLISYMKTSRKALDSYIDLLNKMESKKDANPNLKELVNITQTCVKGLNEASLTYNDIFDELYNKFYSDDDYNLKKQFDKGSNYSYYSSGSKKNKDTKSKTDKESSAKSNKKENQLLLTDSVSIDSLDDIDILTEAATILPDIHEEIEAIKDEVSATEAARSAKTKLKGFSKWLYEINPNKKYYIVSDLLKALPTWFNILANISISIGTSNSIYNAQHNIGNTVYLARHDEVMSDGFMAMAKNSSKNSLGFNNIDSAKEHMTDALKYKHSSFQKAELASNASSNFIKYAIVKSVISTILMLCSTAITSIINTVTKAEMLKVNATDIDNTIETYKNQHAKLLEICKKLYKRKMYYKKEMSSKDPAKAKEAKSMYKYYSKSLNEMVVMRVKYQDCIGQLQNLRAILKKKQGKDAKKDNQKSTNESVLVESGFDDPEYVKINTEIDRHKKYMDYISSCSDKYMLRHDGQWSETLADKYHDACNKMDELLAERHRIASK